MAELHIFGAQVLTSLRTSSSSRRDGGHTGPSKDLKSPNQDVLLETYKYLRITPCYWRINFRSSSKSRSFPSMSYYSDWIIFPGIGVKIPKMFFQTTTYQLLPSDLNLGVLFVTFSGVKWPAFGISKGHLEEAGRCVFFLVLTSWLTFPLESVIYGVDDFGITLRKCWKTAILGPQERVLISCRTSGWGKNQRLATGHRVLRIHD